MMSQAPLSQQTSPSARTSRKRPAEDMTQYAEAASRKMKLRPADHKTLLEFAVLSEAEQRIFINANVLKILEQHEKLQPADSLYVIPESISGYIDRESFRIITLPSLIAYFDNDGPLEMLKAQLKSKDTWGLSTLQDDKPKWDVLMKYSRLKLNTRRYDLKKAIAESVPRPVNPQEPTGPKTDALDILVLCRNIQKTYKPAARNILPLELLGRVAFLRHTFGQYEESKPTTGSKVTYWHYVDAELVKIRAKHSDDVKKISKMFAKILEHDQKIYGSVDLVSVAGAANHEE
ncbi:hypothetical protein FIBSPDRAFT_443328 [Athelia psychrophila]|uniref:Uncharacterized protein n=1 Tax=Athelia psychrophila TaxID=1759441 RepID=A0A167UG08_9AGAM|nr:hypothetical protein FIBSPDRAFT_443328 [Fibularhizoctonia sp. CBS 109695]